MEDLKEMKERQMEGRKKNKGFSLVELIIVIAIMAILVGVVGTQVLPYMDKARVAKDEQLVSALCTAATTAFAQHADKISGDTKLVFGNNDPSAASTTVIVKEIKTLMGVSDTDKLFASYFAPSLGSKAGKTAKSVVINYTYSTGTVSVQLNAVTGGSGDPLLSEVKSN